MNWSKLDALEAELNAKLQRGTFRGLPPVTIYDGQLMEAELMARIVLSDIEDIREWDRTHPTHPTSEQRLRPLERKSSSSSDWSRPSATLPADGAQVIPSKILGIPPTVCYPGGRQFLLGLIPCHRERRAESCVLVLR
jgi:hypothetical protein